MRRTLRRLLPLAVFASTFNACRYGYGPLDVGGESSAADRGLTPPSIDGAGGKGGTDDGGMAGTDDAAPADSGGAGGVLGGAGSGGAGGATQIASGCAKLSVPLDDAGDKAHFVISLASPADLSGATISMRFYVQAGSGGTIFNYVQDSGNFHFLGVPEAQRHPLARTGAWETLSWNVGAEPDSAGTGIVKTSIKNIGIELNAQPSTMWSNPTIVYLDSLTVTSPALSFTFDTTASVNPTPTTVSSGQALWLNVVPTDTTAAASALSWQDTCP
ncbi:MAG TPA: hypothetical protein VFK05_36135 [Polyangiaceae bacterium]|nr:hypothetical protein [Polyangiaceae bacterium]